MVENKPDTPLALALEMNLVVFGPPVALLLVAVALLVLLQMWHVSSLLLRIARVVLAGTVLLAMPIASYATFVLGVMTTLEHPRYRAHVVCEPCF